jgi:hypothetical protein
MAQRLFMATQVPKDVLERLNQPLDEFVGDRETVVKLIDNGIRTVQDIAIWSAADLAGKIGPESVQLLMNKFAGTGLFFGMRFVTLSAA